MNFEISAQRRNGCQLNQGITNADDHGLSSKSLVMGEGKERRKICLCTWFKLQGSIRERYSARYPKFLNTKIKQS